MCVCAGILTGSSDARNGKLILDGAGVLCMDLTMCGSRSKTHTHTHTCTHAHTYTQMNKLITLSHLSFLLLDNQELSKVIVLKPD